MKIKKISPCVNIMLLEFPELLFSSNSDDCSYFDATNYFLEKGLSDTCSIKEFEEMIKLWKKPIADIYNISIDDLIVIDENTGHCMIEQSLAILFLAYADPDFAVHILDRIWDLFYCGLVLSDSTLLLMAKSRFTSDELISN